MKTGLVALLTIGIAGALMHLVDAAATRETIAASPREGSAAPAPGLGPMLPPPESAPLPRAPPREVPETCARLWLGVAVHGASIIPGVDAPEPMTLGDARTTLANASWSGAFTSDGRPTALGRAFHRIRASPAARAHFEIVAARDKPAVASIYAACGLADLDPARSEAIFAELRRLSTTSIEGEIFGPAGPTRELAASTARVRLYRSPRGFIVAMKDDAFRAHEPGRFQVVRRLEPFRRGGDITQRPLVARRVLAAIEGSPELREHVPDTTSRTYVANIEVRGDALRVGLGLDDRPRFAVRFFVDAETGEARDIHEVRW